MKFRNVVLLFIIAALVLAWYTKPTMEDFKKFRESSSKTIIAPPLIEVKDGFVYAMYTVSYYNIKKLPQVKISNEEAAIAVPLSKEKYIGLFGKFWKID